MPTPHPKMGTRTQQLLSRHAEEIADQLVDGWRGNAGARTPDLHALLDHVDIGLVGLRGETARGRAFLVHLARGGCTVHDTRTPILGLSDPRHDIVVCSLPVWAMVCELAVEDGLAVLVGQDPDRPDRDRRPARSTDTPISDLSDLLSEAIGRTTSVVVPEEIDDATIATVQAMLDSVDDPTSHLGQLREIHAAVRDRLDPIFDGTYYGAASGATADPIDHDVHVLTDLPAGLVHLHADSARGQLLLADLSNGDSPLTYAYEIVPREAYMDGITLPEGAEEWLMSLLSWPALLQMAEVSGLILLHGSHPGASACFRHLVPGGFRG